jgi:5-methylcytosine-specific restriction endonuclease McrA
MVISCWLLVVALTLTPTHRQPRAFNYKPSGVLRQHVLLSKFFARQDCETRDDSWTDQSSRSRPTEAHGSNARTQPPAPIASIAACDRRLEPPPHHCHPARDSSPDAGCRLLRRGVMSHRSVYRVALPRAPRGLARHHRRVLAQQHKRHVKRATFRDCGRRCVYCGTSLGLEDATLDHVFPLSKGGNHAAGNLVAACSGCNQLKGAMLPTEFFARYPWAGTNFMRYARAVHRTLKRGARRAVSLAYAEAA